MSNIQGQLKEQLKHAQSWQKMEIKLRDSSIKSLEIASKQDRIWGSEIKQ
ncbi:MAG: hypothetical protein V3V33_13515 [Candidatus Lokiarchaeia archaeon]